jgi:mRNA-degrading endonuclease RelE of RelBE toxin-antitoxin system
MNEIKWHNRARKQMKLIPIEYREAIHERVDMLVDFPAIVGIDVKELRGHQYQYRLRVGRYRVLFGHDSGIKVLSIQEVKKRDERTY